MPLKKCTTERGVSGWKWGDSGKCFSDKQKAIEQGQAIEASKHKRGKASEFDRGGEFYGEDPRLVEIALELEKMENECQ